LAQHNKLPHKHLLSWKINFCCYVKHFGRFNSAFRATEVEVCVCVRNSGIKRICLSIKRKLFLSLWKMIWGRKASFAKPLLEFKQCDTNSLEWISFKTQNRHWWNSVDYCFILEKSQGPFDQLFNGFSERYLAVKMF
jgi:hypothetical protein